MLKKYFFSGVAAIVALSLLSACFPHVHDSNVSCDITTDKEYIIKWDVFPKAVGNVSIYISDNPETFDTRKPIAVVDADEGVAFLPTPDPMKRHYFLLDFNGCFSRIVAARASFVRSAYDFRDLGGYSGVNNKKTKWGMIYRTGTLDTLSEIDKQRIKNIAPKTIIEYRDKEKCIYSPSELGVENVVYMPYTAFDVDSIVNKIYNSDFSRDEARIVMNEYYFSMIDGSAKQTYARLFDILADEKNYPIILSSPYGKGFNDMASLFILTSLGVSSDEIYEDYTWANKYFCKTRIVKKISHLPSDVREAVASIMHNNHRDMFNVVNTMLNRHESIDKYMIDSLALTLDKRKTIHRLLLVDESRL